MEKVEFTQMENVCGGAGDPTIVGVCAAIGVGRTALGAWALLGSTVAKAVIGGPVGIGLLVATGACIGYTVYSNY
ncbi:hypothetical protein [Haliscomenobacter sp.]|uniref:hypothetical protein n=1 Tax=Haliscomenobacter sp. TaxID=2717303 RepID=UPI003364DFB5